MLLYAVHEGHVTHCQIDRSAGTVNLLIQASPQAEPDGEVPRRELEPS